MIGAFDMQLTQKLAKEYKKANKKRKGKILTEYCLLTKEQKKILKQMMRKERVKGLLESYINGILERNPEASAWSIYNAIISKFDIPIMPNMIKQVRRIKEKFKKRKQRGINQINGK